MFVLRILAGHQGYFRCFAQTNSYLSNGQISSGAVASFFGIYVKCNKQIELSIYSLLVFFSRCLIIDIMYKLTVQTEEDLPPHQSDIYRVLSIAEPLQLDCHQKENQFCRPIVGKGHLFKALESEGLLSHPKSRGLFITCFHQSLKQLLGERKEQIEHCRIIEEHIKMGGKVIGERKDLFVIFKSTAMAEEIYNAVKSQPQSLPFYVQEVTIHTKVQTITEELYNQITRNESKQEIWVQIPFCAFCLDILEQEVTGVQISLDAKSKQQNMKMPSCLVCWVRSKVQATCQECSEKEDNWVCMICGIIGCGRYKNADACKHYQITTHSLSLDLTTNRVWNYKQDCFSHKVVERQEWQFGMVEGQQYQDTSQEALETAFWKYCCVVSEQLEKQRNFYHKIKQEQTDKLEAEEKELDLRLCELSEEREKKQLQLKKKVKKNKKIEKKNKELEQKCSEERALTSHYEAAAKTEFLGVETELARKKKQLQEVEAQIEKILTSIG